MITPVHIRAILSCDSVNISPLPRFFMGRGCFAFFEDDPMQKMEKLLIGLPTELKEQLRQVAEVRGSSIGQCLRDGALLYLDSLKAKTPAA